MAGQYRGLNILLRHMANDDFAALAPAMTVVDLVKGENFAVPDMRLLHSWFPLSGIISVVATTALGKQAEIGIIGREGMVSVSTIYGVDWETMNIFNQIPGRALRVPAAAIAAMMSASPSFRAHLLTYAQSFTLQIASSALAFATRAIEERLARWLLMSLDRLDTAEVALTHEALSLMLGVRRAGVNVALNALKDKGALSLRRSAIIVINRSILLAIAGDAYGSCERAYARLTGAAIGPYWSPVFNGAAIETLN